MIQFLELCRDISRADVWLRRHDSIWKA